MKQIKDYILYIVEENTNGRNMPITEIKFEGNTYFIKLEVDYKNNHFTYHYRRIHIENIKNILNGILSKYLPNIKYTITLVETNIPIKLINTIVPVK